MRTAPFARARKGTCVRLPAGDGADLFQRTASRLMEMRTEAYLGARHEQRRVAPRS